MFYRKPFFSRKFIVFLCNCFCFFSNKLGKFSQFFTCGVFHYFPAFSYRFLSFLWVNGFWPPIHYVLPSLLPQFMRYLSGFFSHIDLKEWKFSYWPTFLFGQIVINSSISWIYFPSFRDFPPHLLGKLVNFCLPWASFSALR